MSGRPVGSSLPQGRTTYDAPRRASRAAAADSVTSSQLSGAIDAFLGWLTLNGLESYDPYDVWGTAYGIRARRTYYENKFIGAPLVAPIALLELLMPSSRRLFVRKARFATAEAQIILGFLNLFLHTREQAHLERATNGASELLTLSIGGFSGHCWGYPFDWQNNRGLWPRNTPFITATPYCFEAFTALADATGDHAHLETANSIARFVAYDLRDSIISTDESASSYSPIDQTKVINASAYRAYVLLEAWRRFGIPEYSQIAERNLNFVIRSQRDDGSWLYGLDSAPEAFIDHFHTCFVLKNLTKIAAICTTPPLESAVARGWRYYRRALFDADDTPKSFAIEPRTQIVRDDMYNYAEAITLGTILRSRIPEAFELGTRLAARLIANYQLPDGHFVTRTFRGGARHTVPFVRWPQAQLFLALTNMLRAQHAAVE